MKFKVLCSDLDGTLLTTKSDVSAFTVSEISKIKSDIQIILVSARMPKAMRYIQKDLGILNQPIICYNGALIISGANELFSTVIPINVLSTIYSIALKNNVKLGLYYKDEWYVEENSERVEKEQKHTKVEPVFKNTASTIADWKDRNISAHKIMLMGTKESADTVFSLLEEQLSEEINSYRSNDTLIEIAPKSVSKLSAINSLLENNCSLQDVISFGDNYNDIEMLKNTGCGIAVGNARVEAKEIANAITLKNTEDGVAYYLQQNSII